MLSGFRHSIAPLASMPLASLPSAALSLTVSILVFALSASAANTAHVTDLYGRAVDQLVSKNSRVVVLIFAASDCPISRRYIPEIARLQKKFNGQAAFWTVYSNPGDTPAVVRAHEHNFPVATPALIDARQNLVHLANATVTPEAAVFAVEKGKLREVYHGRIDDLYSSFGHARPAATHHDLEAAIQATLMGQPVQPSTGGPVGCSIVPLSLKP